MRAAITTITGAAWLLAAASAMAHHSFTAVFDINRPVEITGTVTGIEWTNPHAWFHVDVEDADGNVESWSVELLGVNSLLKRGWTPDILQIGIEVAVTGYGARDGGNEVNGSSVTIVETGQKLWVSDARENYE